MSGSINDINQMSTVAASNTNVGGISTAPGWSPANVGPAFRELMALLARMDQGLGTLNELEVTGTLTANIGGRIVGELIPYGGQTAPPGTLLCYGQAVSRSSYSALFAAIGATWGAGDGSTTFNVPDLRGRSFFGADAMGGTAASRLTTASLGGAATLGATGGSELLMAHGHAVSDSGHTHGISDPGHAHGTSDPGHVHAVNDPGHNHGINNPPHTHGVYDPGHSHGVSDPGHYHSAFSQSGPTGNSGASSGNPYVCTSISVGGPPVDANSSYTGVGVNSGGTGIGIDSTPTSVSANASGTGVGLYGAATGVSVQGAATGVSANYSATGISVVANGAGGAQNVPPAAVGNWLIFAGV